MKLSQAPFWTPADAAELDVLLDALLDSVMLHCAECSVCRDGGPWCGPLREAFEIVLDWRRARVLLSLAVWLRARQQLLDDAAGGTTENT